MAPISRTALHKKLNYDFNSYSAKRSQATDGLAAIFALSKTQMYYDPKSKQGNIVVDSVALASKKAQYNNDPAIKKMAEKYADPKVFKGLTGGIGNISLINMDQLQKEYNEAKKSIQNPEVNL